jgi:K+-transporting ATPase ATPase C chain
LIDEIKGRIKALKAADPENTNSIPVDLVTSSGSGLDPQISIAASYYQIPRIAKRRGISENAVKDIIRKNTTGRFLGLIGEPVVNVLKVNLDLETYKK